MAENISDVTVNISIEDVVNPAAFGGICLFTTSTSGVEIPYTEVYSTDEAETKIKKTGEGITDDQVKALKNAVKIAFSQETKPEKVAVLSCPAADIGKYDSCDYRYLIPVADTVDNISTLAEKTEASTALKMLAVGLNTEEYTAGKTKIDAMTQKKYARTFVYVNVKSEDGDGAYDPNQVIVALMAKTSCKPVGSFTYKNQTLVGVSPDEAITKAELDVYHKANINAFVKKAGYNVTSEGVCLNGEYIDIMDARDWLITQIQYQEQQTLIVNDKVPYDNTGIGLLENTCVNVLQTAFENGMIAADENGDGAYTVNFKPRSETKVSDREQRQYVEGRFSFQLAGAIHTVVINGVINI